MIFPKSSEPKLCHQYPTVRQYMTPMPCTIGSTRSLAAARRAMLDHGIRHLPVLEGGRLVGVLSERDLFLVESLPGVNPTEVRVSEAMVANPYTVSPEAAVAEVVDEMIARKLGSALAVEVDGICGVFTTIDALRALRDQLTVE
jgi:acetoin utilization protein AcuB